MKRLAQQVRPASARVSRTTPRQVCAPAARASAAMGAGNHRRADTFERQADEIAGRVGRGARDVHPLFTPAPAAGFALPGSRGLPLAGPVRLHMERALGADLAAVRVHTNPLAARTAADAHAHALTSGRDIFFADRAFAPGSEAGRRLLAHELAHVLQQTGRRNGQGVLRATAATGTAAPQAKRTCPLASSTTVPDFDEMAARHKRRSPHDKSLAEKISKIKSERDAAANANNLDGYWDDLSTQVQTNAPDYDTETVSVQVLSFVYDCLKLAKKWEAAAYLLARAQGMMTSFFSAQVYEFYPVGAVPESQNQDYNDFIAVVWLKHPFLKPYSAQRFLDSISDYLLGPTRAVQDLGLTSGEFQDSTKKKLAERDAPTELIENELVFVGLETIRAVDKIRTDKISELAQKRGLGKKASQLSPKERVAVAEDLVKWTQQLPGDQTRSLEISALLKGLALPIASRAVAAAQFWRLAYSLPSRADDMAGKELKAVRAGLAALAQSPAGRGLHADMAAGAEAIFKLDATHNPLSPAEYSAATKAFAAKLRATLFKRFEQPLLLANRNAKPDQTPSLTSQIYGWIILQIYDFFDLLQEYNEEADQKLADAYSAISPNYDAADVRIRHRLKVAHTLTFLATVLEWQDVKQAAEQVATPAKNEKSLLAIFSDFAQSGSNLKRLTKDFDSGFVLQGLEPLTIGDLHVFFSIERYQAITADLKKSLAAETQQPGSESYGLVKRAIDVAETLDRPRRYVASDFSAALRKDDQTAFADLLGTHPRYLKLVREHTVNGVEPLAIKPLYQPKGEIVVWLLPPLQNLAKLIARFRDVPAFNELIYQQELPSGTAPAAHPDLTEIAQRPWDKWLESFHAALNAKFPWTDPSYDEATREAMRANLMNFLAAGSGARTGLWNDFVAQKSEAERLLRAASIIDRLKRRDYLRSLIGEYDRYDQFSKSKDAGGGILRFEIPTRMFEVIAQTVNYFQPEEDQPMQQAALILELAEAISDKFQAAPRLDVMIGLLPMMEAATDAARKHPDVLKMFLTGEEAGEDWINARATTLEEMSRLFHSFEQGQQKEFGMQAVIRGPDKFVAEVEEGYVIKVGEKFAINGIDYTLVDIKHEFVYHPRHGNEPPVLTDQDGKPLSMSLPLVEVRYNDAATTVVLKGSDEEKLTDLAYAVTLQGIILELNALAEYMQGAMELTLDVLELIPGPGQALMAARLVVSIIQFIASDEFKVFVDFVKNDPIKALEQFGQTLSSLLDPGNLWEYLFFGNNVFDQLHETKTPPNNAKVPKTRTEKMTKVVMRLYNFGKHVLGSLGRLQTHTRWQAEHLEVFVLSHPTMAWLVRLIADHIDYISTLAGSKADIADDVAHFQESIAKALDAWPDRVIETVDGLRKFELPDEIVPLSDLVEIVISMVIKHLPLKYRIASNVVMRLLQLTGKDVSLYKAIGDGVKGIGLDPNEVWRKVRNEYIQTPFREARNQLAAKIFQVFADIPTRDPGSGDFALITPAQQKKFLAAEQNANDGDFKIDSPTTEVWPFAPGGLRGTTPSILPRTAGTSLSSPVRRQAERGFGRDLSHVRVHRDRAAGRFTRAVGAQALTGGSHIFLSPQVNPSTPGGRWVLNHELAHVVQHSAPRHRGPSPLPVSRGRGVVQNPTEEASASHAADALRAGRALPSPAATAPTPGGLRPFGLINVTRRLLDTLAGTTDIEHDEAKEEHTGAGTGLKKLPPNIKKQIDKLWEGFRTALDAAQFTAPFDTEKKFIIEHLTNKADSDNPAKAIEEALGDLAIDSTRENKETGKDGGEDKITYVLDEGRLAIALTRFVLAKSGVIVRFELAAAAGSGSGSKDPLLTFKSLHVVYVHLAEVHGNSRLWQDAIKDVLAGKEHGKYLPRIRAYLEEKGPSPGTWDKRNYQLTKGVITAVEEIIAASQDGALDASLLPTPEQYLSLKKPSGVTQNVGLRLGVYGDSEQKGPERESHHITQYLLLEYFHGKSDKKPFPLLEKNSKAYPGVKAGGDATANSFSSAGKKTVDLSGWEHGRGGKMPAILLAAPTHRTGRLHVTTKADDFVSGGDKTTGADSPADVVHRRFRSELNDADPAYTSAEGDTLNGNHRQAFRNYVDNKRSPGGADAVIHTAMMNTYHWMRDFMQPRLETALLAGERKYYDDLGKSKGYKLPEGGLETVFAAAASKNKAGLTEGGWV